MRPIGDDRDVHDHVGWPRPRRSPLATLRRLTSSRLPSPRRLRLMRHRGGFAALCCLGFTVVSLRRRPRTCFVNVPCSDGPARALSFCVPSPRWPASLGPSEAVVPPPFQSPHPLPPPSPSSPRSHCDCFLLRSYAPRPCPPPLLSFPPPLLLFLLSPSPYSSDTHTCPRADAFCVCAQPHRWRCLPTGGSLQARPIGVPCGAACTLVCGLFARRTVASVTGKRESAACGLRSRPVRGCALSPTRTRRYAGVHISAPVCCGVVAFDGLIGVGIFFTVCSLVCWCGMFPAEVAACIFLFLLSVQPFAPGLPPQSSGPLVIRELACSGRSLLVFCLFCSCLFCMRCPRQPR